MATREFRSLFVPHCDEAPVQIHNALDPGARQSPRARITVDSRIAFAVAVSLMSVPAWANSTATKHGGEWFDGDTWTTGIPSALDSATISPGDTVTVTRPGAGASMILNDGVIDVRIGTPPDLLLGSLGGGNMVIGYGGTGQVNLSGGATVSSGSVQLAYTSGSAGIITIDGTPNIFGDRSVWTNSGQFTVGGSGFGPGAGTVLLTNGGTIKSVNTFISSGTSTGAVDVNNSTWTNTSLFSVGHGGTLGALTIENHGIVNDLTGAIGSGDASTGTLGTAVVDNATWNNTGDFHVGSTASAQLTVVNGGIVKDTNGYIGYGASSVASASFSHGTWTNSGGLFVGFNGDGQLLIGDGSMVTSASAVLGRYEHAKGAVVLDNATWTNTGELVIGHGVTGLPGTHATGELVVRNGGKLTSTTGQIGYGAGSMGTVEVKGVNAAGTTSTWTMDGDLYIGNNGTGTLTIGDGGIVKSPTTFVGTGANAGAGGTLNLNGTPGRRGVLETGQIVQRQGTIIFDGGIVRASANQSDFLRNVSNVSVHANGAFIDSNNHNIGIGASLIGDGGLTKLGQGTLDLRGISSLGGLSTVDAGKLLINTRFSGDIQVNSGATLGGTGEVVGAVHVLAGGILSPGNSPGNLTLGSLTLDHDSILTIELGPLSDHLTINGDVILNGIVNFIGDPAYFTSGTRHSFISYTGTLTNHGIVLGSLPAGVDRSAFALDWSTPGLISVVATPPVPEPGTAAMLAIGVALLWSRGKLSREHRSTTG
ncbi:MAG: hypothetical protein B7Y41_03690 [Hydrogenophilales bacterium 28-61-23]|nr:MAG: hypothetical protein B7Y41_03690 [Hydrogenophilales bacterium 28-61-23]